MSVKIVFIVIEFRPTWSGSGQSELYFELSKVVKVASVCETIQDRSPGLEKV